MTRHVVMLGGMALGLAVFLAAAGVTVAALIHQRTHDAESLRPMAPTRPTRPIQTLPRPTDGATTAAR